jgi:periplasmic protein TonB
VGRRTVIAGFGLLLMVGVSAAASAQSPAASPTPIPSPGILGDYDEPPRPKKIKQPKYPAEAFRRKLSGTVLVRFVVTEEGTVKDARVIRGIPEFDAAALEATRAWRFEPARKAGQPVEVTIEAPITFRVEAR